MKTVIGIILAVAFVLAINYAAALIGEPRSLWLMQLIGVM